MPTRVESLEAPLLWAPALPTNIIAYGEVTEGGKHCSLLRLATITAEISFIVQAPEYRPLEPTKVESIVAPLLWAPSLPTNIIDLSQVNESSKHCSLL